MTMLMQIKDEVKNLPKNEFDKFRTWFLDYESSKWEKQIKQDSKDRKLDFLAKQAMKDFENKNYKSI